MHLPNVLFLENLRKNEVQKSFKYKELISLSKSLNLAYELVDRNLIHKFSKKFSINKKSAKIIIRRNMVPLTYFFL